MLRLATEPIQDHWTADDSRVVAVPTATASDVSRQLGLLDIDDLDDRILEFLSAAAAELAHATGIAWRQSNNDPPVALLRLVAKVAIRNPTASGRHTARLFEQLA
jgi:hypothetical protein